MSSKDINTSKAELVYRWLREEFTAGRIAVGDRLPSENDLCSHFEASRPSIRQATARLAHEGFVRSVRGKGTFRLSIKSNNSRDVAIVLPRLTSYIYPELVSAANSLLNGSEYQTLFDCSKSDIAIERAILERLVSRRPAGLIISPTQHESGTTSQNLSLLKDLRSHGVAVVLLDNTLGDHSFPSIILDDHEAGIRAGEYLMDRGHEEPCLIWSDRHAPFHERRRGFLEAIHARHASNSMIELSLGHDDPAEMEKTCAEFISERFDVSKGNPMAFFCVNDTLALAVRGAALTLGLRIPEDLSLIGFDDSPLAQLPDVSLSSFAYPSRYIGERAASIAMEAIEGSAPFARTQILIDPVLIERGSVLVRT